MIEFGVEWKDRAGKAHVGGRYTLDGARKMLASSGDPKRFMPYAARVVERDVSEWREAEIPCGVSDSATRRQSRSAKLGGAPRQGLDDPAATTCPSSALTGKEPLSS